MTAPRRIHEGPEAPRGATDLVLAPPEVAGRIHNFVQTDDNTLRAVVGPAAYVPLEYEGEDQLQGVFTLTDGWGIAHTVIHGGQRPILLAHLNGGIYEHQGWTVVPGSSVTRGWTLLIGTDAAASYQYDPPEADDRTGFLTQFVATPTGFVIIPQGGRAFFYDGDIVAPLGYAEVPGPPSGLGATTYRSGSNATAVGGFVIQGRSQPTALGNNRVGTLQYNALEPNQGSDAANPHGGVLQKTSRRVVVQWVDVWGNVSAPSPPSDILTVPREENLTKARKGHQQEPVEALRHQMVWTGVQTGRDATVGRIIGVTKDLESAGDPRYFAAPADTGTSLTAFATLPDNSQTVWADNIPDGWLLVPVPEVDPVPQFRLGVMAFGRLWIANWPGQEGFIRPSAPGRWGTFPANTELAPDPNGLEITGMVKVTSGLIICTEVSTYLVTPNDEGTGFRSRTINTTAGCVSPNSMAVLPDGMAVWLGREGWYGCDGERVELLSQDINRSIVRDLNRARWRRAVAAVDPRTGEYRCWVPTRGSRDNNICVVFKDGIWRTRDDVDAKAVCTTADHRGAVLALGTVPTVDTTDDSTADSFAVWVLDHAALGVVVPVEREAVFESVWLRNPGTTRGSGESVEFMLRATNSSTKGTIEVMRDWKEYPVLETHTDIGLAAPDEVGVFWGTATLDSTYSDDLRTQTQVPTHWTRRRPYWERADMHVPDCETYKVRLRVTGDVDIVGLRTTNTTKRHNGASRPGRR